MVKRTSLSSLRDFVAAEIPDAKVETQEDKTDEEEEEASTVKIERLVLGPMDLSSPNRKGSKLVMKAKLESCQLSLEWQPERKVIVNVPFDAIRALQVSRISANGRSNFLTNCHNSYLNQDQRSPSS